ncbi:hypothetical protein AALP_AA8G127700 [Arabis alpina]|uniref:Uncharacterized protein n=1 Tax=Arabis alpina TaxID=50452 RepID=A0A087G6N3_ARAAL|nr:hypothetical protein AALP_AA8G127700 [Arabis alpina]
MAAMKYKASVLIIIIIILLSSSLVDSSSTKSFFWLGETEDMNPMKKEKEIVGESYERSANEVEGRQVPTGSDPLHHNPIPFTSTTSP